MIRQFIYGAFALALLCVPASAQNLVKMCVVGTNSNSCIPVATGTPFPVTGSITQGTSPWIVSGGGTAGTAATGVVTVQGIASMTPFLATGTGTAGTPATGALTVQGITGQVPMAISRDATANGNTHGLYSNLLQGDAVISGTNGLYSNLLQGNAALSATNGLYANQLQGNAVLSVTNPTFQQEVPGTAGGLSNYVIEPAASDNHAVIKAGGGQVYAMQMFNNSATINYVRLYNATTGFNGCNSATNLAWEGHIPASTSDAGFTASMPTGIAFATGISICVTGAYGQTDTTNATASAISLNIQYK